MSSSNQPKSRTLKFTVEKRAYALECLLKHLFEVVAAKVPQALHRDPNASLTRSQSADTAQLQNRLYGAIHLLYFIINGNVNKQDFNTFPDNHPPRDDLEVSFNGFARLPLNQELISLLLQRCLATFSDAYDKPMCCTLANTIMNLLGYKNVCSTCSKRFQSKTKLDIHIKAGHAGNRRQFFCCSFYQCNVICADIKCLINHHQEAHGTGRNWQENIIIFQLLKNAATRQSCLAPANPVGFGGNCTNGNSSRTAGSQHAAPTAPPSIGHSEAGSLSLPTHVGSQNSCGQTGEGQMESSQNDSFNSDIIDAMFSIPISPQPSQEVVITGSPLSEGASGTESDPNGMDDLFQYLSKDNHFRGL